MTRILWAALFCWAVVILGLSSLSMRELPHAAFLFWDKVNHVLAYLVGGWLAGSALRASRPQARVITSLVAAVAMIGAFGILDETVQMFTPGRSGANADDWVADVVGATAGALLTLPTQRRLPR